MNWIRVNRANRCPVCQHPDWCCIGAKWILCMRVASDRECKSGGWFHAISEEAKAMPRKPGPIRPTIDAEKLMRGWWEHTTRAMFSALAASLGVAEDSLVALKCAWAPEYSAWAFPMRDGGGSVTGVRLRLESGQKLAVKGSREGVFIPTIKPEDTAWIVEGPTNCAANLSLGKYTLGRPSCMSGIAPLCAVVARLNIRQAVLVADNDEDKEHQNGKKWNPGLDGAKRLADEIGVPCCTVVLPVKDSREFLRAGGTTELLDSFTHSVVWQKPNKGSNITHAANLPVPVHA